jgi:hypothetical protein
MPVGALLKTFSLFLYTPRILPEERLKTSLHVSSSKRTVLKTGDADFCLEQRFSNCGPRVLPLWPSWIKH